MNAPRRLIDNGGTALERALILSARDDRAPEGALERAMASMGVSALGAGAKAASSGSMKSAYGLAKWLVELFAWVTISVAGGALLAGGPLASGDHGGARRASIAGEAGPTSGREERRASASTSESAGGASSKAAENEGAGAAAAEESPRAAGRALPEAQARGRTSAKAARPTLADEIALLDTARAAIARGDAASAIAALDKHARDFPGGSLGVEAAVLRVDGLVAKGDRAGAVKAASELLAANPTSPHASHLRAILSPPDEAESDPSGGTTEQTPHRTSRERASGPVDDAAKREPSPER